MRSCIHLVTHARIHAQTNEWTNKIQANARPWKTRFYTRCRRNWTKDITWVLWAVPTSTTSKLWPQCASETQPNEWINECMNAVTHTSLSYIHLVTHARTHARTHVKRNERTNQWPKTERKRRDFLPVAGVNERRYMGTLGGSNEYCFKTVIRVRRTLPLKHCI